MNTKTVMSFKIDKDVRDKARKAAKAIGLPLSTIVNQNLKQFVASPSITFGNEIPLPAVGRQLLKATRDRKARKNVSPVFDSAEDAIRWMRS